MIQANQNAAGVFTDINGLQGIRSLGKADQDAALKEVAKQFESMFIGMMMKSMRDASTVFSEDSLFNSPESDFFRNMYDDQMSVTLTEGEGTGLADVIHRQLMAQYGKADTPRNGIDQSTIFERRYTGIPQASGLTTTASTIAPVIKRVEEALERQAPSAKTNSKPNTSSTDAAQGDGSKGQSFASPEEFVATLYPYAKNVGEQLGVDPKAIVAQAALETGWGKHTIQDEQGRPSNNLFGIKADSRWQGDVVTVTTHEYVQGVRVNQQAAFRSYPSLEAGLQDYANFLKDSSRYQSALQGQVDGTEYGHALQQAGYATDPQYGNKIHRIYQGDLLNGALPAADTLLPSSGEPQAAQPIRMETLNGGRHDG